MFSGGDPPPAALTDRLPVDAFVVAADSGLAHAVALERHVDLVVGDLDSVDLDLLAEARRSGSTVEAHPSDKDQTDLELALDAATARGYQHLTVVGGHGGRLDHFLANLTVLASPRYAGARVDAWVGQAHVVVVRGDAELLAAPGSLLTLVPLGGSGARDPHRGAALRAHRRGSRTGHHAWGQQRVRRATAPGSGCGTAPCSPSGPTRSRPRRTRQVGRVDLHEIPTSSGGLRDRRSLAW